MILPGSDLATRLTSTRLDPGPDGLVRLPETPGLGVRPDMGCVREYLQPVTIEVAGEVLYETPELRAPSQRNVSDSAFPLAFQAIFGQ